MNRGSLLLICVVLFSVLAGAQSDAVKVVSVAAHLEDKNLVIEIIALNRATTARSLTITTNYFGEQDVRSEELPKESTKKLTYTIHNVQTGKVTMEISGNANRYVQIMVPDTTNTNQELLVQDISREDALLAAQHPDFMTTLQKIAANPYILGLGIAVIVVIVFLLRLFVFRNKSEVELEKNAELLEAADAAKKEQRTPRKKIHM